MGIPDVRVKAHVNLFNSLTDGGPIAVFYGLPRYQCKKGFGDFFRGLIRRILPIALNVGKSELSAMTDAQEHGASLKNTLRSAVRPAPKAAIHGARSQIDHAQQGSGSKRGRKHKTVYKGHKAKRTKPIIYNFFGDSQSS